MDGLTKILPENLLADEQLRTAAQALDAQFARVLELTRQVLHVPRLDELNGVILDLLNWQFHTDFYEPLNLSDEQKRALIRDAVAYHRRKGTVAAVEELAAKTFRGATVQEWFDYGGEPYHFRIATHGFVDTQDGFLTFKRMVNAAKNVRSHLDSISVDLSQSADMIYRVGFGKVRLGGVRLRFNQPRDISQTISVGFAKVVAGNKKILAPKPEDISIKICAGTYRYRVGRIIVGDVPPPPPPRTTTFTLPVHILTRTLRRSGHITCPFQEGYADVMDEDLPADFVGRYAWFRFFGDTFKRSFKVLNVREDITQEDLQEFADYLVDNKVLLNTKGEPIRRAVRATVHVKTATPLYEETKPEHDLPVIDKQTSLPTK